MKVNQSGFSLTQILISVGLTGILALVLLKTQENSLLTKTKSNDKQIQYEATRNILNTLQDRASCSFSLRNKNTGQLVDKITKAHFDPNNFNNYLPQKQNQNPTQNLVIAEAGKPLGNGIMIKEMKLIQSSNRDYLSVELDLDYLAKKKMVGSRYIKKLFLLNVTKNAGIITSCYAENSNPITITNAETCLNMRGTMIAGKCDFMSGVVDSTPANCPPNSSFKLDEINGKVRVVCSPCTLIKKFVRNDCEKRLKGVNWLNICYYVSSCAETNTTFGHEFWEVGGTSASGGDTGTKSNCFKKRKKCSGEP